MDVSTQRRSAWSKWYLRMPLKWSIFALVTWLVLWPDPRVFMRQQDRIRHMNRMVTPDAPELARWDAEIQKRIDEAQKKGAAKASNRASESGGSNGSSPPRLSPAQAQRLIERFTYEKVKYAWDWDLWGCADYMPTIAEMFAKAQSQPDGEIREDCDGRAVMAASLMRRFGYDAELVTDIRHVWVKTKQGEWMGPGRKKTIVATPQGPKVDYATVLSNSLVGLSYGVQVFPFARELILWATALLLMIRRGRSWGWTALGGALLLQGLLFMRTGHMDPLHGAAAWPAWVGLGHLVAGFGVLLVSQNCKCASKAVSAA